MIFECHESPRLQVGKRNRSTSGDERNTHDWHAWSLATPWPWLPWVLVWVNVRTSGTITITSAKTPQTRGLTVVAMTALAISTTRRTWKTRADRTTYSFHGLITSSPCFLGILVLGTQVSPLEMTWNMDDFPAPANMDL